MFARNDTVYLSCGDAGLYIFDLKDLNNQKMIGSINSYPDQGYNHSSWLDKSGKYLMFTDENMGLDIKIFDINDLNNPLFISQFNSNASTTSHNAYWVGDFAYVSAYHDGVRVYNIKDPANPKQVAWFDTHPEVPETYGGYKGCWGVYPYLPSKHIIASDLTAGIFVFEIDSDLVGTSKIYKENLDPIIYPNPTNSKVTISNNLKTFQQLELTDARGKLLKKWNEQELVQEIDLSMYPSGIYFLEFTGTNTKIVKKIAKW
jgi:hypothetical protein